MIIKQAFLVLSITFALALSGCSRQQSDWEKTRTANTTDAYELFVKKYPSGEFTPQAQARLKELYEESDWQKARDTDTLEAYQAFLKQYPEGKWTEEARIRVENFTLAAAPSCSCARGERSARARGCAAGCRAAKNRAKARIIQAGCRENTRGLERACCEETAGILWRAARRIQVRRRCRQQALGAARQGISAVVVGTLAQSLSQEGRLRNAVSFAGRGTERKARARDL